MLETWYRSRLVCQDAKVTAISTPKTGAVNETYLHTVTFPRGGRLVTQANVCRPQPLGEGPIPDVEMLDQTRTLHALATAQAVPSPRVLWEEPDDSWLGRQFFIMERLIGEPIFDTGTIPTDPVKLHCLFDQAITALVRIHAIDWKQPDFNHLSSRVPEDSHLRAQLDAYRRHLTASSAGKRYAQLEEAYAWLTANVPRHLHSVLNWGDARIGNLLFEELTLTGVLDWEMATIAPREVDVGWFIFMERFFWTEGQRSRPGGPTTEEMIKLYEDKAGVKLHDISFFERWAAFRLGVMRLRAGRQMIARGEEPADSRIDEVNPASLMLARVFGLPAPS
ncbi:MAG: phosphotransferase family protein [Gammaproteobacteria bacterium]|nr:phosphotransferase family protein [Gammaproteobacteria bacterium]